MESMSYSIKNYPDKTSYVEVTPNLKNHNPTFRINTYEDLWHLNQYVDAINEIGITPTVTIPNLLDAQADRRFAPNQSSGLKLVLKFLNSMDAKFKIFHPHNPEIVEAVLNHVEIIDNSEFTEKVLFNISQSKIQNNIHDSLILMSSDAGGFKPLVKLADKLDWQGETFSASKARSWDKDDGTKFVQQIDREDFGGKDILIVDDISVYGGTFKGLSKLLRSKNVGKLYLAVSHMTVRELGKDPVTNYFDKVFTTNSKYKEYLSWEGSEFGSQPENLEVIKMFLDTDY